MKLEEKNKILSELDKERRKINGEIHMMGNTEVDEGTNIVELYDDLEKLRILYINKRHLTKRIEDIQRIATS